MSNTLVQYRQALAFPYLVWHSSASREREREELTSGPLGSGPGAWGRTRRPGPHRRSRTPGWSAGSRGSPGAGWCGPATWPSGPAGRWRSPDCSTPGPQSPPEDGGGGGRLVNTQSSYHYYQLVNYYSLLTSELPLINECNYYKTLSELVITP